MHQPVELRDSLMRYVQWRSADLADVTSCFRTGASNTLIPLVNRFRGYTWLWASPPAVRAWGICWLPYFPNANLCALEKMLFDPSAGCNASGGRADNFCNLYLIAETADPQTIHFELAMRLGACEWHVLDGHIVRLSPVAAP